MEIHVELPPSHQLQVGRTLTKFRYEFRASKQVLEISDELHGGSIVLNEEGNEYMRVISLFVIYDLSELPNFLLP
jgi:hypothetical protein